MKILIIKLSALGDVTHTLPALTALRRAYPEATIDWLVEERAAPIIQGHPSLNRALVWSRRRFTSALRAGSLRVAWSIMRGFVRDLRSSRYDLIIDFQSLLKSAVWVVLSRGVRKAGFGRGLDRSEGSYLFLNERVPAVSMEIHALDRGLKLLTALGVPQAETEVVYDLPVTADARGQVGDWLRERGVKDGESIVAVHPMTRWPTKLWYPERFAAVADALSAQGCRVVFTGAEQDGPTLDEIAARSRHPFLRLDGLVDLKGLAALYEQASVVVSTDTGPMHMAAAVGTPVVALFGPTAPNRTGPYGEGHVVLRAGVSCRPCFSRECRQPAAEPMGCMKGIQVDAVVGEVMRVLGTS